MAICVMSHSPGEKQVILLKQIHQEKKYLFTHTHIYKVSLKISIKISTEPPPYW